MIKIRLAYDKDIYLQDITLIILLVSAVFSFALSFYKPSASEGACLGPDTQTTTKIPPIVTTAVIRNISSTTTKPESSTSAGTGGISEEHAGKIEGAAIMIAGILKLLFTFN